jgi:enoyl-CoA hydratase
MINMASYNYWILEKENSGIIHLIMNRPAKKNAWNQDVLDELDIIMDDIIQSSCKILIIESISDNFFTTGADIAWFYKTTGSEGEELSQQLHRVFSKILNLEAPVIAAVKGMCLTVGVELAVCCDLIIAADNAKFGQIETKWGLTPGAGGTQRLVSLVGPLKARELIFTAKIIDANEAYRIGLTNEVVPLSEFDDYIKKLCEQLLNNSQSAIKDSKFLIQKAIYENEKGYERENVVFGNRFASGEPAKLFQSFISAKQKS